MIPQSFTAGDSVSWTDAPFAGRGPADFDLVYQLRGPGQLTVDATPAGDGWSCSIPSSTSASLPPGLYGWAALLSSKTIPGQRFTVATGQIRIGVNLASVGPGYDPRTLAQRALEDLKTALADFGDGSGAVRAYTIGDRSVTFESRAEILKMISFWEAERQKEIAAQGGAAVANSSRYYVRFGVPR